MGRRAARLRASPALSVHRLYGAARSFDDRDKADRVSAILAAVGIINVPIIHYSVEWWSTLHQGPTIARLDSPAITTDMLVPLLIMIVGFTVYFAWLVTRRLQAEILDRERSARWVRELARRARNE